MIWDTEAHTKPEAALRQSRLWPTNSDPLAAFQDLLRHLWARARWQAMLAPVVMEAGGSLFPQVITDPTQLRGVNPFAPLLAINSAGLIDDNLAGFSLERTAVVLRPCEQRTYIELLKRSSESCKRPLLISFDCAGTLPEQDFVAQRFTTSLNALTDESFQWVIKNRWVNPRLREACQICDWPAPIWADLSIGIFGLDPNEYLLVTADPVVEAELRLAEICPEVATEEKLLRHSSTTGMAVDRRSTQIPSASGQAVFDPINMLAMFARCTMCADCLDACPLYSGELSGMIGHRSLSVPFLVDVVSISRWLAGCTGCGVCQDNCNQSIPLFAMINATSRRIRSELGYLPGDPTRPLPWT